MLNLPKTTHPDLWYELRNSVLQKKVGTNQSTKGSERGIEKYRGKRSGGTNTQIFVQRGNSKSLNHKNIKGYCVIENFILLAKC